LNWQDKSVLITGGNGFLGKNLTLYLLELGIPKIRVIDNLKKHDNDNYDLKDDRVEFINSDLRHEQSCINACDGMDIVFHCASKVGSINYYKNSAYDVISNNVLIDSQILKSAVKSNISCFVYISSAFVYPLEKMQDAYSIPLIENEAFPANPVNSYGWAKLMGELSVKYAVDNYKNFKGVIARLSNFYGPHQSSDYKIGSIIPVLIRKACEFSKNDSFEIYGNGCETRTYCYISDVLDALCISVAKSYKENLIGPVNIGSEIPIKIVELAEKIIKISGKPITLQKLSAPPPLTMSQTLNCTLAKNILDGWVPKISIDTGLKKMFKYFNQLNNSKG